MPQNYKNILDEQCQKNISTKVTSFDILKYLKKVIFFTDDRQIKEIRKVCLETNLKNFECFCTFAKPKTEHFIYDTFQKKSFWTLIVSEKMAYTYRWNYDA